MGFCVCAGALCACSFGAAPSALMVMPENRVFAGGLPVATIMDDIPIKNIQPFGMCSSPANPQVAAATAAAAVAAAGRPVLNADSRAFCMWGGVIQITAPGSGNVLVP